MKKCYTGYTTSKVNPDWSLFNKRPTWGYVSAKELAQVLGVKFTSINNFLLRDKLPPPAPEGHPKIKGNKNFWRISVIRSYFECRAEEEIHQEWLQAMIPDQQFKTIDQAKFFLKYCYKEYGIKL